MLLLPHHYEFQETLADLPFFYKEIASCSAETLHILQKDGIPELVTELQLRECLLSGELDEQIELMDAYAQEEEEEEEDKPILWDISDVWLGSI